AVFRLGQLPLAGGHELEARRLGDERLDVPDAPQDNPFAVADPLADGGHVFDALDVAVRRPDDLRRVLALELFRRRVPRLPGKPWRSEEHTSELQSRSDLVCRPLLEKKRASTPPGSRSGAGAPARTYGARGAPP